MKRIMTLVLALALCLGLCVPAMAADSDFVVEKGTLKKYNGPGGDVVIPDGIFIIAREVFKGRDDITSVRANDVNSILDSAFSRCSNLTDVNFPVAQTIDSHAFYSCEKLKNVSIAIKADIGEYAFCRCFSLTNESLFSIVSNAARVRPYAFLSCTGITECFFPKDGTEILNGVYSGCTGLTQAVIPDGVQKIGDNVFENCTNLKSVTIPDGVITIGSAFSNCKALTQITLPDSVVSISGTFAGTSIKSITLPNKVTTIGKWTFENCTELTEVRMPNNLTTIGDYAFQRCKSLKSLTIPNTVTSIGKAVFSDCESLSSIVLPSGLTSIEESTFSDFTSLTNIIVPEGVTSIELWAFRRCSNLKSITIPASVTKIRGAAFDGCTSLKDIYFGGSKAQWEACMSRYDEYMSSEGDPIPKVTVHYNSSMPAATVITKSGFTDVPDSAYYADAVKWAAEHDPQITNGIGNNKFGPEQTVTRGQAMTFLWRAMGSPAPTLGASRFTDVGTDKYYYDAVQWAVEKGIAAGVSPKMFYPDYPVTRGQMATFLYRTMGEPGKTGTGSWYTDAVNWAEQDGLLVGTAEAFTVEGECPRGDVIYYMHKELAN